MDKAAHPTITNRIDSWWSTPLLIALGWAGALGNSTWAAFQNAHYIWGPYISPIYSAPFVPDWWKLSPAFLLLWIPAGFRLTCYYARKTYYHAAFGDPANCAVEEPYRKNYTGETKLPFILSNLHRYFLYGAIAMLILHWYEMFHMMWHDGHLYFGVGTLLILIDTLAITAYVGTCHSIRHIIGGGVRCFSCTNLTRAKDKAWKRISFGNLFHNRWFWLSFYSICVADIYVRLLSMGIITTDLHFTIF